MPSGGYESVSKDEAPAPVDGGTVRLAIVVSALSCALSLCAIAFIVVSLKSN
jgi:hypothetical protein